MMMKNTYRETDVHDVVAGDIIQLVTGDNVVDSIERHNKKTFKLRIRRVGALPPKHSNPSRVFFRPAIRTLLVRTGEEAEDTTPTSDEVTTTPTKGEENTMATATKIQVTISGRVGRVVDTDIKGLTVEEKSRGRGTSLVVEGSASALKKLSKGCATAFESRKGSKPDEYEDRYQAGEAVKKIDAALA